MITKFPCYYIMGANTNVGKSVFSAAICQQATKQNFYVDYIKPIQTGYPEDCDRDFVSYHCKSPLLKAEHFFAFSESISPHRVLREQQQNFDAKIISNLHKNIESSTADLLLIEAAGGVASPSLDGNLQCDMYRHINLPVVFVADSRLGGISTAISSIELLYLRGFEVACILIFEKEHENYLFLRNYYQDKIPVFSFQNVDFENSAFQPVLKYLFEHHQNQIQEIKKQTDIAKKHFWWPFTQHQNIKDPQLISSALDDDFCIVDLNHKDNILSKNIYDASASWWTQGVGHASAPLALAAGSAAARFGHVMFPGNVHTPAAKLAQKLIETVGKNWANRVFFSDNGSTAIEVALKMAFRKSLSQNDCGKKPIVLGLKDSYHGDTHAAMDATAPNAFKDKDRWYHPRGVWLNYPSLLMKDGSYSVKIPSEFGYSGDLNLAVSNVKDLFSLERLHTEIANSYFQFIQNQFENFVEEDFEIGACILEGVIQGAGGMRFVDPLFQKMLIEECQKRKIPVILDEVFTGFWRLGEISASSLLNVYPDIACYGKLLTGGLLPMAVTMTTEDIFEQFLGVDKSAALLHGHSYTANPTACATSVAAIEHIQLCKNFDTKTMSLKNLWNENLVKKISYLKNVERVLSLGSLFVLELKDNKSGYLSQCANDLIELLKKQNIDARPLGNVIYILAGFNTEERRLNVILEKILEILV